MKSQKEGVRGREERWGMTYDWGEGEEREGVRGGTEDCGSSKFLNF